MQFMFRKLLPALALFLLVAAGCNNSSQAIVGGKPRPKEFRAVISLSPSATEVIAAMSKGDVLRGRTASCNYPALVQHIPVVAGVKPDYELIAKIKPDLIVYDKDLYSAADIAKLKEICPDHFSFEGETVDAFTTELSSLSAMLGGESNMSKYVDKIFQAKQLAQSSGPAKKPKVAMLMAGQGSEHMINGIDSFQADELRDSGGEPVGPKGKLFVSLSPEVLIQADPDFVITAGDPAGFLKDSRFKDLRAVKENHVFGINADIALRRGGRVDVFIQNVSNILAGRVHG